MPTDRPKITFTPTPPTGRVPTVSERLQANGAKAPESLIRKAWTLQRGIREVHLGVAVRAGHFVPGAAKAVVVSLCSLLKSDTPRSAEFLEHYVGGSGQPYELKDIPTEWQDWIAKQTGGRPGVYKDLSPYNAGIMDLRNSLGHFDVHVTRNADGSKTYEITDKYAFGYKEHDAKQEGRHGFPVTERQRAVIEEVGLPAGTWKNPGGFDESFEIKKVGQEYILYVPQQVLAENGTPFEVKGSFTRSAATH